MRGYWKVGMCALVGLLACSVATAQFRADFEDPPYTGTAAGTILTGQGPGAGFYIPAATTSTDYLCYDYAGNTLLIPNHPILGELGGADQFVAGTGPAGGTYARAQLDITWGKGKWTAWYDFLTHFDQLTAGDNLGSFSTQIYPGEATYIHLFSWMDIYTPSLGFKAYYLAYDAAGVAHVQPGKSPGPEWENMPLDNWYRAVTTIDYDANQIIAVSIIDLHTGKAASFEPTDWYLEGGSAGGLSIPTGFRFFAGGGVIGNSVAWDNTCISAGVGIGDLDCSGKVDFGDIDAFVLTLSGAAGYYAVYPDCCYQNADCNLDGVVDFDDIDAFVALLSGP